MKKRLVQMGGAVAALGLASLVCAGVGAAPNYGPAGCGLGSLIFEPDSGFTQIFAATTNSTFGNQTFGITTGSSNCDPGSKSGERSTEIFVASNREAVAKDIARGSGETIESVARLAGCKDSQAVGRVLQQRFNAIVPAATTSDAEVGAGVVRVLKSEKQLGCGNLV
jgi:DUF3015 family protein